MYAVVETGGKQYKVMVGQTVDVERLDANVGDRVELDRVLMVSDGEDVQVGRPVVENARIAATVLEHGRGKKVIVFKYRAKQRYRRKKGHRQEYTRLRIDEIQA
ncbi:MAG TPA: 50S ribosomal protein L21 [Chloroflexi bacterium]|jgi:large subunit ribosomal protein L21|nr:50S ribosomal protein L21 [Chloroflexota bacterium]